MAFECHDTLLLTHADSGVMAPGCAPETNQFRPASDAHKTARCLLFTILGSAEPVLRFVHEAVEFASLPANAYAISDAKRLEGVQ